MKENKYKLLNWTIFILCFFLFLSCRTEITKENPNIILIMADDMGYECLSTYGSTSYSTPVLDELASSGIKFENCVSQPLCTPSRVKIMTGLYNYRNYDYFGHLNTNQFTFANLLQEAGYATCIAGKWQLNGLAYKNEISDWNDNTKPNKLGFDEYCLWQLTKTGKQGGRYADPLIEQNGKLLKRNVADYGPDIFSNFILEFIEREKNKPFFIYYPMVLVHDPFVPTPESELWHVDSLRQKNDTIYYKDMVAYTDKIVGRIIHKLEKLDLIDNTIVIFTGDNGTHPSIYSHTETEIIRGGKGNTTDAGTHVPLIISWPKVIKNGSVHKGLIEFSDFFATFAELLDRDVASDGKSFYPLLKGENYQARKTAFVHYDPKWNKRVSQYRNQFIRTIDYKLYQNGNFYNLDLDILEKTPLSNDSLEIDQLEVKNNLKRELIKHPNWN